MKAHGNGLPETCASNLLRTVRGEVAYDRVRGRNGSLIHRPNVTDEIVSDAEWLLSIYEPRVNVKNTNEIAESAISGEFDFLIETKREEGEA